MAWGLTAYLGLVGKGKSTHAFHAMGGRGLFITFKGVPPHIKPGPPIVYEREKPHAFEGAGLKYCLTAVPQVQMIPEKGFDRLLDGLRRYEGVTVVFDDINVLVTASDDPTQSMRAFDSYIKEIRQRGHNVIITTHRLRRELSPFVRETARIVWVGPCPIKDTRKDLLAVMNVPISEEKLENALLNNPDRVEILIKG